LITGRAALERWVIPPPCSSRRGSDPPEESAQAASVSITACSQRQVILGRRPGRAEAGPRFRWRVVKVTNPLETVAPHKIRMGGRGQPDSDTTWTQRTLHRARTRYAAAPEATTIRHPTKIRGSRSGTYPCRLYVASTPLYTQKRGSIKARGPERFPRTRWNVESVVDVYRVFRLRKGESS
jgi:hypothetical protein